MGYTITFKKNIILNSNEVQLPSHIQSIMPESDSIIISKTYLELSGWDVAEAFDSYRREGSSEIAVDDLKQFLQDVNPELIDSKLEDESQPWTFFSYFESY